MLKRRQSDQLQYLLLMVPALVVYTAFHVVPILQTIGLSMTNSLGVASTSDFIGLRNFRRLLIENTPQQETFFRSFKWTAIFWLGNWTLNILLGLGFALMLFENIKLKRFFLVIIFLPYVVSNLAIGYIMRMILDPSNGAINWLLIRAGAIKEPLVLLRDGLSASFTMITVTGWKFAGFNLTLFLAGLVMIPEETLEAAAIAGCSYWQKLIHIILPQLWPTTIAVSILCFTGTWQLFAIPIALSGTSEGAIKALDTVAVVYYRWAFGREGFGMASALMVLIALGLFAGSVASQRLMKRKTIDY
ncbi:MAG: sugar ABC transporter permease [Spirochaetaceae bacterium]|nr:sugar ABC transporter permease [Spirochaetaceae bacterium]